MEIFWGEFIGTMILILLGNGVVANIVLQKTNGHNAGWIVITVAWGIAVFTGVYVSNQLGGSGHLNPVVSLTQAMLGNIPWDSLAAYMLAQFAGAFSGAVLTWVTYRMHFHATEDANAKLGVFCTAPAIRNTAANLVTEMIGTFVLIFGALMIAPSSVKLGALDAFPVALLVMGIGLSLGGPTGYAINPARDLGPRIAHFILPIPHKRDSDWGYAWIPVIGPILGGLVAVGLFRVLA